MGVLASPPCLRGSSGAGPPSAGLRLTFDDGVRRDVDLSGELWGPVFEPLKDP
jgi:hypothetical protein